MAKLKLGKGLFSQQRGCAGKRDGHVSSELCLALLSNRAQVSYCHFLLGVLDGVSLGGLFKNADVIFKQIRGKLRNTHFSSLNSIYDVLTDTHKTIQIRIKKF